MTAGGQSRGRFVGCGACGAVVLMLVLPCTLGVSISWTGYGGDNQWTNRINWAPDQVPTINDDVTIASGTVEVTIATGANSISMGTSFSAPANLTIFQSFVLGSGGLTVDGNGNLIINAGSAAMSGVVQVGGTLLFHSGQLSGQWTVNQRGVADLGGGALKALSGCSLTIAGSLSLSGVLALNQSSTVVVTSSATLSGSVSIQAQDTTQVLFDSSSGSLTYAGGGEFQIQAPMKLGTFAFLGGNLTMYDDITLAQNLTIPSGSFVTSVGSSNVVLSGGVSGSGVLSASGSSMSLGATTYRGVVNAVAGNLSFSAQSSLVRVVISGGALQADGAVTVSTLSLTAGTVSGSVSAANVSLRSPGFNLNGALTVTQQLTTGGASLLAFGTSSSLVIPSGATLNVQGPLTLTGSPGPSVQNDGTFAVHYPTTIQSIDLSGSGVAKLGSTLTLSALSVQQNSVVLGAGGVFSGTATQITYIDAVKGSPNVAAKIGSYSFTCPGECDGISTSGTPASDFTFKPSA